MTPHSLRRSALFAAVSFLIAVFTAYLVPYFLHEKISPYIGDILVGRALGIFVVFVWVVTLTKRACEDESCGG